MDRAVVGQGSATGYLGEGDVRRLVQQAFSGVPIDGTRVLAIVPDGTRTMPMPLMFAVLGEVVGTRAAALDYLVALGTHAPMSDEQLGALVGHPVADGRAGQHRVFNHRWDLPDTFVTLGVMSTLNTLAAPDAGAATQLVAAASAPSV